MPNWIQQENFESFITYFHIFNQAFNQVSSVKAFSTVNYKNFDNHHLTKSSKCPRPSHSFQQFECLSFVFDIKASTQKTRKHSPRSPQRDSLALCYHKLRWTMHKSFNSVCFLLPEQTNEVLEWTRNTQSSQATKVLQLVVNFALPVPL